MRDLTAGRHLMALRAGPLADTTVTGRIRLRARGCGALTATAGSLAHLRGVRDVRLQVSGELLGVRLGKIQDIGGSLVGELNDVDLVGGQRGLVQIVVELHDFLAGHDLPPVDCG